VSRNFLNIAEEDGAGPDAPYWILPVPYEQTVSYGRGCARGPAAILEASAEVELFDEELEAEPYRVGIHTLPFETVTAAGPEVMVNALRARVSDAVRAGKTVITLGGEHSLTPGPVRACQEVYPDLSVLQIDAHADLRDGYQDCHYSHASAMMRVRDTVAVTVGVGIRNLSQPEFAYARRTPDCHLSLACRRDAAGAWIRAALERLTPNVYVTIDLDGLDSGIMPAVGTPEPGGLSYDEVLEVLRQVTRSRHIVGADVVELAPIGGMHAPDFLAARLTYKLIGYIERGRAAARSVPPR
jgi:agmatinase